VGALVDGLLFYAAVTPATLVVVLMSKKGSESMLYVSAALTLVTVLPFAVYQFYLVAQGQSLGKRVAKTRVVRLDGSAPGFVHGVVLRNWLLLVVGVVPGIGGIISLVDLMMVFRTDRRSLRDHIASTRVIQS